MKIFPKNIANFYIFSPVYEKNNLAWGTHTIFRARLVKSVYFQMGYTGLTPRHSKVTSMKKIAEPQRKDVFGERREMLRHNVLWYYVGRFFRPYNIRPHTFGIPQS